VFLYIQTVRHTEYFAIAAPADDSGDHARGIAFAPSLAWTSVLLVVSL